MHSESVREASSEPALSGARNVLCGVVIAMVLAPVLLAPPIALLVALPAALAAAVALMRWPWRNVSFAVAAMLTAAVSLLVDLVYPGPRELALFWMAFEATALWLIAGRVARQIPVNRLLPVGALTGLAIVVLPLRFTLRMSPPNWIASLFLVFLTVVPAVCAVAIGLYLRSLDNRRLRAVAQARRDQRLRVAGDLHDFVAHEVTGIVVEVQAAQVAEYDPAQMRALLGRIEQAGLRALESMDRTVRALRDPNDAGAGAPPPMRVYGLRDLPELVDRFAAGGNVRATLELPDRIGESLNRETEAVAYMTVLEALTNVRRHGPDASEVTVSVAAVPDGTVAVSVTDNGGLTVPLDGARTGGGTGLIGLGERVQALGGTLSAGPHEDGWQTRCILPATDLQALRTVWLPSTPAPPAPPPNAVQAFPGGS